MLFYRRLPWIWLCWTHLGAVPRCPLLFQAEPCYCIGVFLNFDFAGPIMGLDSSWGYFDVWPWSSMIDTNDNFNLFTINLLPCHWWKYSYSFLLPLSSCCSPYHDALLTPLVFYLPLRHQWQREYPLMISCLVLWGGNHSQFLSEILKRLSWKWLSEDVCNLLLCVNIFQSDILFCDMFS